MPNRNESSGLNDTNRNDSSSVSQSVDMLVFSFALLQFDGQLPHLLRPVLAALLQLHRELQKEGFHLLFYIVNSTTTIALVRSMLW